MPRRKTKKNKLKITQKVSQNQNVNVIINKPKRSKKKQETTQEPSKLNNNDFMRMMLMNSLANKPSYPSFPIFPQQQPASTQPIIINQPSPAPQTLVRNVFPEVASYDAPRQVIVDDTQELIKNLEEKRVADYQAIQKATDQAMREQDDRFSGFFRDLRDDYEQRNQLIKSDFETVETNINELENRLLANRESLSKYIDSKAEQLKNQIDATREQIPPSQTEYIDAVLRKVEEYNDKNDRRLDQLNTEIVLLQQKKDAIEQKLRENPNQEKKYAEKLNKIYQDMGALQESMSKMRKESNEKIKDIQEQMNSLKNPTEASSSEVPRTPIEKIRQRREDIIASSSPFSNLIEEKLERQSLSREKVSPAQLQITPGLTLSTEKPPEQVKEKLESIKKERIIIKKSNKQIYDELVQMIPYLETSELINIQNELRENPDFKEYRIIKLNGEMAEPKGSSLFYSAFKNRINKKLKEKEKVI